MPSQSDAPDPLAELHTLPREVAPDPALEERVISALREQALVRSGPSARRGIALWLVAAGIAVVAFGLGNMSGRARTRPVPNATFALMLYGGSTGSDSLEHAKRADEYRRWASARHEWGSVVGGEALGDSIGTIVASGRSLQQASALVGFFLIAARDRAAAVRLAAHCPHIKYGGSIVVREILPT